jgi:hypothetical protein
VKGTGTHAIIAIFSLNSIGFIFRFLARETNCSTYWIDVKALRLRSFS